MNMSNDIIRIIDLRGKKLSRAQLLEAMPRAQMSVEKATELVGPVLEDVKNRGAAALRDFSEKFDAVRPENLRVPRQAIEEALRQLEPRVREAIEESVRRCRAVSKSQIPQDFHTDLASGARVSQRWIPVQRVGLYVPGGKAVYPSSVIMNAVPAQTAGVESLAIATPPSRSNPDGLPDKTILATCAILGVDEVYAVGGAQAIAMFAYGAAGSEPQDGQILDLSANASEDVSQTVLYHLCVIAFTLLINSQMELRFPKINAGNRAESVAITMRRHLPNI